MGTFLAVTSCKYLALQKIDAIILPCAAFTSIANTSITFKPEVEHCCDWIDEALMRAWNRMKLHMNECTRIQAHTSQLCLLWPEATVVAVVASQGAWSKVQPQLVELAGCSKIGKPMFAFAIQVVNGDQLEKEMAEMVTEPANYCFSLGARALLAEKLESKIQSFESKGMSMSKRRCAWNYFGIPFQLALEP